jgi:hypothetical protein
MSAISFAIAVVTVSAGLGAPLSAVPNRTGDEPSNSSYPKKKKSLSLMIGPERVHVVTSSEKVENF